MDSVKKKSFSKWNIWTSYSIELSDFSCEITNLISFHSLSGIFLIAVNGLIYL
jgi:hypothetical protein